MLFAFAPFFLAGVFFYTGIFIYPEAWVICAALFAFFTVLGVAFLCLKAWVERLDEESAKRDRRIQHLEQEKRLAKFDLYDTSRWEA